MNGLIKSGTIVVAMEEQSTSCGIRYVKTGSILKVAETAKEWYSLIDIYRNHREEADTNSHRIERDKLRFATDEEAQMYANRIYYVPEMVE